ncbi:MAG: hypothetical protein ACRDYY_18185 [Acidimicrobiales bacterium]
MSRGDRSGWGFWRTQGPAKPVGGSDYHRPGDRPPGWPTTWLEVDGAGGPPEPELLIAALREGPVAMSVSPAGPLAVPVDGEVVALGAEGLFARAGFDGAAMRVGSPRRSVAGAGPGLWSLAGEDGGVAAVAWVRTPA